MNVPEAKSLRYNIVRWVAVQNLKTEAKRYTFNNVPMFGGIYDSGLNTP